MKVNEQRKQMYFNGEVDAYCINKYEETELLPLFGLIIRPDNSVRAYPLSWFFEQDEPQTEPRTPTAWRLNIDVPEYQLSEGDKVDEQLCPKSILKHISTPIYTTPFTLESGQEVELSDNDIKSIVNLKIIKKI